MENIKIPHKSFDEQMHIIRDVHFDIDKYKVGELYVINNPLHTSYLHFGEDGKTVAKLIAVDEHSLTFNTMRRCEVVDDITNVSYKYTIHDFILTIDEIIKKQIEIERLMTETEAAVYLMGAISKECAKEIIPEPINEKTVLDEAKQSTLDMKDPKFNRLLGIVPDFSQYPYTLERTHSYHELPPQHTKNDDITKLAEEEKRNYVVWLVDSASGYNKSFSILDSEGNFDKEPFEGLTTGSGRVRVKLVKGSSVIQFNVHSKFIKVAPDAIIITGNKNKSSICMSLMMDNFREMFDKIEFLQIL